MAKYSGSFIKGLGEGLGTGFQIGQQAKEWKWQKKENERIQKEKDDITESVSIFNKKIEDYYADGTLSDDEKLQLNTAYLASAYNVQEVIKGSYDAVMKMDKDTLESNLNWLKFYRESLGNLDPSSIPELYEYTKGQMIGEKGKQMFIAGDSLLKKQYEALQPEVEKPSIGDYGTGLTYLKNIINVPPENWESAKKGLESKFGFDYSGITQEALKEAATEDKKYYSSAEEAMTTSPDIKGLSKQPVQISLKQWKVDYSKETVTKPIPEGEITAGEKRTYDMASSIMFGSSDWVTGISKPGIISTMISNKLNMGQPLTDEEKTEVRNNYNTIKGTLPGEVISAVESQLQRYGIPLEEPTPTITPTPTPEPEPKKWWEFWKEGTKPTTPEVTPEVTPGITPTAEKIPTPKVPTGAKAALIPTMTKKELEDAIRGLDPSDPLYKLIYDEAVKRGYITK